MMCKVLIFVVLEYEIVGLWREIISKEWRLPPRFVTARVGWSIRTNEP